MIKLELPLRPAKLTDELQAQLTQEYKDSGKSVWDKEGLKDAIYDMAFGKCCYTEIRLGEESKYMEVEHFFPKDLYPDEVMTWGNLLPSCKKCNVTKGKHDTQKEPIINPFVDNPKDYLYLRDGSYKARDTVGIGKRTIKTLALNNMDHCLVPRTRIADRIKQSLENIHKDFDNYQDVSEPIGRLKRLLRLGDRKEEYSALVATTILQNISFQAIVEDLTKGRSRWDDELEQLYSELEFCALPE